jgi:hypothetical protein
MEPGISDLTDAGASIEVVKAKTAILPSNYDEVMSLTMMSTGDPKDVKIVNAVIEVLKRENWRQFNQD